MRMIHIRMDRFNNLVINMLNIRRLLLGAAIAMMMVISAQAKNQLNLFIWSEYIDPEVVSGFEKEFDCKVVIDLFEDEAGMMAKLQGGGTAMYDVVVPPNQLVQPMVKLKLLAPLRHENLPNLSNLEERFRKLPYDMDNKYSVAYQWGSVGIYARKAEGKTLDETWGLIFDPKQQIGPFVMIDTHRDILGAALKYKGFNMNSTDKKQLKEAADLVLEAKKRSLGFDSGVGGKNRVLAKGATVAVVFNGDAIRGMEEDKDTVFFVPKEGGELWVDNLVVPAKAPHRDMAEKFINYLLDAKVGAQLANWSRYATPNKAAREFIKPEDLKNSAIYPPEELLKKMEYLEDIGSKSKLYDELWSQIKSK